MKIYFKLGAFIAIFVLHLPAYATALGPDGSFCQFHPNSPTCSGHGPTPNPPAPTPTPPVQQPPVTPPVVEPPVVPPIAEPAPAPEPTPEPQTPPPVIACGGTSFSGLPESAPLPLPNKIHNASNASQLRSALIAAAPCDHIVLANGNYGNVTLSKIFPVDKPVVIRAANLLDAKFSSLNISSTGMIVSGVAIHGSSGVKFSGRGIRLTRCTISGGGGIYSKTGHYVVVDHCDISGFTSQAVTLHPPATHFTIARNYFHDGRTSSSVMWIGQGNKHREHSMRSIVRYNYMDKHPGSDFMHWKSSDNEFSFNHVVAQSKKNEVSIRHGRNTKIIGNVLEGPGRIAVNDYNAVVLGNRATTIALRGGNKSYTYDYLQGKKEGAGFSTVPASRNAKVAGNIGKIEIGHNYSAYCKHQPQPAEGHQIYKHTGTIVNETKTCISWNKGVTKNASANPPTSWGAIPSPVNLSKKDVGPHAK